MRVKFKDRRQFESCWVKDISNGGIFLRTQTPAALFGKLLVVLELPNGDSVELTGEVVRVVPPQDATNGVAAGMGVQFVDLDADKRSMLESYLGHTMPLAIPEGLAALGELLLPSAPGSVGRAGGGGGAGAAPMSAKPAAAAAASPAASTKAAAATAGPRSPAEMPTLTGSSSSSSSSPFSPSSPFSSSSSSSLPASSLPLLDLDPADAPAPRRSVATPMSGPPPAAVGLEDMVHGLRRLVWLCADNATLADADFYEVLGVAKSATGTKIADAAAVLRALLDPQDPPPGLSSASSARALDLCRLLDDIEHTLLDTGRRARYDGTRRRR